MTPTELGLGVVSGKGYEIAVTLGTGFGTAFLIDGYSAAAYGAGASSYS
ncbi:hypothetical protein ACQ86N_31245 [Puia sp. P3]